MLCVLVWFAEGLFSKTICVCVWISLFVCVLTKGYTYQRNHKRTLCRPTQMMYVWVYPWVCIRESFTGHLNVLMMTPICKWQPFAFLFLFVVCFFFAFSHVFWLSSVWCKVIYLSLLSVVPTFVRGSLHSGQTLCPSNPLLNVKQVCHRREGSGYLTAQC